MFRFARAAGYAAAALAAVLVPTLANPSLAWSTEAAPHAARYIDHAAAKLDAIAIEMNSLAPAEEAAAPLAAVAQHAIATFSDEDDKESPRPLSALVADYAGVEVDDGEMECLAGAIYFESKGEPLAGQLAVAEVIINRSRSGRYPATLCGVVKQRGQFSFVRGGRMPPIAKNGAHWRKAVAIAHIATQDLADSPAENALAFHATHISPGWRMKRVARVGNHIFYR